MKKKLVLITVFGVFLLIQPLSAQIWEKTKRLTFNSGNSSDPAIVVDSNNHLHVVWEDDSPYNSEIYYKKSTNGGATWTTKRLTWSSHGSLHPDIAVDSSDHLHIVWNDGSFGKFEIVYKKSTNGGTTWTTKRLTYNFGSSFSPAIAVDSDNHLHVVWCDETPGNDEILYKKSTNGGATWTTKRLTYNSSDSIDPAIAVDSDNYLHVVWCDETPGNYEIFYKRSTNGGTTWTTKRLTYNFDGSYGPAMAVDSDNHLHVVWEDYTPGNAEIYYKRSTNGGTTWTTRRLTYNSDYSWQPAIALDSDNHLHVVWNDWTPGNYEIFYKRSTDGGTTWTTKRLTYNSGPSFSPDIAVDSDNYLHVVWEDYTPGNDEIYYKKGIQ